MAIQRGSRAEADGGDVTRENEAPPELADSATSGGATSSPTEQSRLWRRSHWNRIWLLQSHWNVSASGGAKRLQVCRIVPILLLPCFGCA